MIWREVEVEAGRRIERKAHEEEQRAVLAEQKAEAERKTAEYPSLREITKMLKEVYNYLTGVTVVSLWG